MDVAELGMKVDSRQLKTTREEMGRFSREGKRVEGAARGVERSSKAMALGMAKAATAIAGAVAAFASLSAAVSKARAFSAAMAEVSTLANFTRKDLRLLDDEAKRLAATFGGDATSQAKAFYQAISAGAGSVAEATQLLEASNRLAIGGVTDVTTATGALASAVNAYGKDVLTYAEVSDALFVGMKGGVTTVGELAASLGKVTPLAASAGVSFDQVVASVSALTKGGISTTEAVTGLRAILAAVTKPSKEAADLAQSLGIEFNTAGIEALGMAGFMEEVAKKTGGSNEQLALLFGGVEAIIPAMALAGASGEYLAEIMEQMGDKAGATAEAFDKVAKELDQRMSAALGKIGVLATTVGQALLSVIVPALEIVAQGAMFLNDNFAILMAGAGGLALVLGGRLAVSLTLTAAKLAIAGAQAIWAGVSGFAVLAANIGLASAASATASLAITGLSGALVVLRGALLMTGFGALVVGAGYLVYQFTRLVEATGSFGGAMQAMRDVASEVAQRIPLAFSAAQNQIDVTLSNVRASVSDAMASVLETISDVPNKIVSGFEWAVDSIGTLFKNLPGIVGSAIVSVVNSVLSAIEGLLNKATAGFNKLIAGLNAIPGVNISEIGTAVVGRVEDTFGGAIEKIGEFSLSDMADSLRNNADLLRQNAEAAAIARDTMISLATSPLKSMDELRATMDGATTSTEGAATAADEATATLAAMGDAASATAGGGGGGGAAGAIDALAGELDTLRGQLDPAWQATQDYAEAVKTLKAGLDAGLLSQGEFNDLLDVSKDKFLEAADAASKYGDQVSGALANFLSGQSDLPTFWEDFKQIGVGAWTDILKESFAPGGEGIKGVIGGLSDAFSGVMAGLSAGGLSGIMSAVSSAMPIIGAVVGVINLIKGFHTSQVIAQGVSGSLGLDTLVNDFEVVQHTWLWGLFTTVKETEKANNELTLLMRERTTDLRNSIVDLAATIGASAVDLSGVVHQFKIDAKDMDSDQIKKALEDQLGAYGDLVAKTILGSKEYLRAGEGYLDALKRMAEALPTVNAALETLGHTMFDISLIGADAASALAELFGGIEGFAQSANLVFERFYRSEERVALLTSKLTGEMSALGYALPETRDEFRQLLEAQNLMTTGGRETYAALMQMAGAFDVILPKFEDVNGSVDQLRASLIQMATDGASAARSAAQEFDRLFDTLLDGANRLRRDALPVQKQFADLQREFTAIVRGAMSGDASAMGNVTGSATALQASYRARATTAEQFALFSAQLAAQVRGVADVAGELSDSKSIEAESLDALVEALSQGELTHDLLRDQIAAIDGLNAGITTSLLDLKAALTEAANSAAGAAANAQAVQLAQINAEAGAIARQLAGTSVPDAVRITGSEGKWFGASYATTSDGQRFENGEHFFNTSKEVEKALAAAQAYVDSQNSRRTEALATQTALAAQLDLLRGQVIALGAVPAFAQGGTHRGGLARIGETDMELVAPSRIYNPTETRNMLDNREVVQELRALRREVDRRLSVIEGAGRATASNTDKSGRVLRDWDSNGLPAERV